MGVGGEGRAGHLLVFVLGVVDPAPPPPPPPTSPHPSPLPHHYHHPVPSFTLHPFRHFCSTKPNVPKLQLGFINFIVMPMLTQWCIAMPAMATVCKPNIEATKCVSPLVLFALCLHGGSCHQLYTEST